MYNKSTTPVGVVLSLVPVTGLEPVRLLQRGIIVIGNRLKLSPGFPPLHTERATFTAFRSRIYNA